MSLPETEKPQLLDPRQQEPTPAGDGGPAGGRAAEAWPPAQGAPSPPRFGLQPCPRCREDNPVAAGYCGRCGFSFSETQAREAPARPASGLVGQTINGKYRVLSKLGEGGFGVVYRVELLLFETGNVFALKLLHPTLSHDPSFRKRFLREAGLAMALIHEHTIQIREFGQTEDGQLFFTMDYSTGEPLKSVVAREGYLTVNRALLITRQVLLVLKHSHARGILHRDIKPENIFLEKDSLGRDFVKVGDFGLAKSFSPSEPLAGSVSPRGDAARARPPQPNPLPDDDITRGGVVGTPRYMSPEQSLGREDLDDRSDLYSIGVVLHEMLFGVVPAELAAREAAGQTTGPPHGVPAAVRALVTRATQPQREQRYATADEFLAALDALPQYAPVYLEAQPSAHRRWPLLRWLVGGVLACALGVFLGQADLLPSWPWRAEAGRPVAQPSGSELRIRGFFPLRPGNVLRYLCFLGGVADREITYQVLPPPAVPPAQAGEIHLRVTPGDREIVWILDEEHDSFEQSFSTLDVGRGMLGEPQRRTLLRLPPAGTIFVGGYYNDTALNLRFKVEPVDLILPTHPRIPFSSYRDCVVVESREEGRQHYHYFQAGRGLVGIEVFDVRPTGSESTLKPAGPPIYARYLIGGVIGDQSFGDQ